MGFLDIFRTAKPVENVTAKTPSGSRIKKRINQQQIVRANQNIKKWRQAIATAESIQQPDRIPLLTIFKDVVLDTHLTAVIEQRSNKVLSRGFKVVNKEGELQEEQTALLKKQWFEKFVKLSLESNMYGYSLIEFSNIFEDVFQDVCLVPREYVVPEFGYVKSQLYGGNKYDYTRPPLSNWSMFVGDEKELGLLNKATPLILWKRLVQATWAEYNELYGMPLRIGKTETRDTDARNNMEDMLENMGSSAWGLFDKEDEIEILNGTSQGGSETFEDFISLVDAQISKLILGQTMTTDDGSSRSQAEVHEATLASYTGADLRNISYLINNKLLPFMNAKGMGFEGLVFEWDLEEKLSLNEQFEIDKELLQFYKIPEDYITNMYGTPVEEKEVEEIAPAEPKNGITVMNNVADMYEGFFKHEENCACGNC